MPEKNNKKNNKTRRRIPRTLLPVLAATAAYAATTPTEINPYPQTFAHCHLPKNGYKFDCQYSLSDYVRGTTKNKIYGHVYELKRTPGADPKAVNNLGCPLNLTSENRSRCRINVRENVKVDLDSFNNVIQPSYPMNIPEGFRFPTYEEMQLIKAADSTAPDPHEPASRWLNYLEFCKEFPKICGASALIAALGLGFAVQSNKKEYNRRVRNGTMKHLRKLRNEGTKYTQRKGNQGKTKPSWVSKR